MARTQLVDTTQGPLRTFMTEVQASARYGKSRKTLRNDRAAGRGLPFYKSGGTILYCLEECDEIVLATRQNCGAA